MNAPAVQATCYHCGDPLPTTTLITAQLPDKTVSVCCHGCRAVTELIANLGLSDYYRFRSAVPGKPATAVTSLTTWQQYDEATLLAHYTRATAAGQRAAIVLLDGVRCAACSWLIDHALRAMNGIEELSVNAATATARIVWQPGVLSFSTILHTLASLGYQPVPSTAEAVQHTLDIERRQMLKRLGVSGLGMMQVMMLAVALYRGAASDMDAGLQHFLRLISLLISTPVLLYTATPFFNSALRAIRLRSINMDVPITLAIVLAFSASVFNTWRNMGAVYFDSVLMFVFFLNVSRAVELWVRHRTRSVTTALARLLPAMVQRCRDTTIETIALTQLAVGDELLVRAGEVIPADGRVITGTAACDESLLTGESQPVLRNVGTSVMAGSLNTNAPLKIKVTATGSQTVLAHIVEMLNRAHSERPRLAQRADQVARWFLQGVLLASVGVTASWLYINPARAFEAALSVLVVTCPCALSLATPVAVAATITALAKRGLLVARADALEQLARIDHVLFDKTGTLTQGKVVVTQCQPQAHLDVRQCGAIAAALEQAAEHPLARAFAVFEQPTCVAQQVSVHSGLGVEGVVSGERYRIGTPEFVAQLQPAGTPFTQTPEVSTVLGSTQGVIAHFTLSDALRPEVPEVVQALQAFNISCEMLSGDAAAVVTAVAQRSGIHTFAARQTPEDKLHRLKVLQAQGKRVLVIGDGINDAPMLGQATASIAMGAGAALAQASADMVLVGSSLQVLPAAVHMARRTQHIVRQNLLWAAAYNICALPLAAGGVIAPWAAAIGMSCSSVWVVLNALRLLAQQPHTVSPVKFFVRA